MLANKALFLFVRSKTRLGANGVKDLKMRGKVLKQLEGSRVIAIVQIDEGIVQKKEGRFLGEDGIDQRHSRTKGDEVLLAARECLGGLSFAVSLDAYRKLGVKAVVLVFAVEKRKVFAEAVLYSRKVA